MRLNKFIAAATGLSRRGADSAVQSARVEVNNRTANLGETVKGSDTVKLDGRTLQLPEVHTTILFHKPVGYVCSRKGQGSQTIYDLLPPDLASLKPVGRLDKDSSGLLLLTNDGDLAQQLSHPRHTKTKIYEVTLDKPLTNADAERLQSVGVRLEDGISKFEVQELPGQGLGWRVQMHEGRNRQIRRTFAVLGYRVTRLHRTHFGPYALDDLKPGAIRVIK